MNRELPDVQAGFRKGRRTRDQIANFRCIIKKAREFQKKKNLFLLYWLYQSLDCVDHNKLWKILKEMGIPDHLTCLLRNLYAGQEATVRTGCGTTDWIQIGRGGHQGCVLSPCLFNLYAEYIMRNSGLEEAQAGIKIAGRNINNLKYADDTTLMAESEEELKSLLLKVKEESEKVGLKLNIQKTKITASGPKLLNPRQKPEVSTLFLRVVTEAMKWRCAGGSWRASFTGGTFLRPWTWTGHLGPVSVWLSAGTVSCICWHMDHFGASTVTKLETSGWNPQASVSSKATQQQWNRGDFGWL